MAASRKVIVCLHDPANVQQTNIELARPL